MTIQAVALISRSLASWLMSYGGPSSPPSTGSDLPNHLSATFLPASAAALDLIKASYDHVKPTSPPKLLNSAFDCHTFPLDSNPSSPPLRRPSPLSRKSFYYNLLCMGSRSIPVNSHLATFTNSFRSSRMERTVVVDGDEEDVS